MSTRRRNEIGRRNPERGAIAIVVAALWMTLFGLAAFAVDVGYQYTTKRGLQTAADAAVMAGMPSLRASPTTAQSKATAMAAANGFTTGVTASTSSSELRVDIQTALPTYFLKVFGISSRNVTARAVGRLDPLIPVLFANSTACPSASSPKNLTLNGGANSTIDGDVHSNGALFYRVGSNFTTTGSVTFSCAKSAATYDEDGSEIWGQGFAPTGGSPTKPMPFAWTLADFPTCDNGTSLSTPLVIAGPGSWWQSGNASTGGVLRPGVYCGSSIILGTTGTTGNVTFVSTGSIQLNGTNATLTAYRNGIIGYTSLAGTCGSAAIQIGNNGWNNTGSFYAPNGCIMNNASVYSQTGSTVANEISISMGPSGWNLRASSAGSASWHMYQ
jgi:Flp pilus assembly protein TadG